MPRKKPSNRADGRYEIKRVIGHDMDGKAVKKSFYGATRAEALAAFDSWQSGKAKEKDITLSSWAEKWLAVKRDEVRTNTYLSSYDRPVRRYILPKFGHAQMRDISALDVRQYLAKLEKDGLSRSYRSKVLMCLSAMFAAAEDDGKVAKNPCSNVKIKGKDEAKKRTYTAESVEALCAVRGVFGALYFRLLVRLGLRASELCGLRWEDIGMDGTASIEQALTAEGGAMFINAPKSSTSRRTVPIPRPLLLDLVEEYQERLDTLPEGHLGREYVAISLYQKHLTPQHLARRLQAFYKAAGVPEDQQLSPHELRHTCGTLLYNATKDVYHVSRFLGHSDIGITTKIYVHSLMTEEPISISFEP